MTKENLTPMVAIPLEDYNKLRDFKRKIEERFTYYNPGGLLGGYFITKAEGFKKLHGMMLKLEREKRELQNEISELKQKKQGVFLKLKDWMKL